MTFIGKSMVAAAALAAMGAASATSIAVIGEDGSQQRYAGSSLSDVLTFSADLLGALDTMKASVAGYGVGYVNSGKDTDGFYTGIDAVAPLTTLSVNASVATLGAAAYDGFTVKTPVMKSVSSGGSLTVSDLNLDVVNKTVYGTLIGANGLGKVSNVALWNVTNIRSRSDFIGSVWPLCSPGVWDCMAPPISISGITLSGLTITPDAQAKFAQGLGLLSLGKAALNGITDYGTLNVSSVPEPSSCTLMGLGLAGAFLAFKRRPLRS